RDRIRNLRHRCWRYGQGQLEGSTVGEAGFDLHICTVIPDNLLNDCEPQSGSGIFTVRHERLENFIANLLRYAGAVIRHRDFEVIVDSHGHYLDSARLGRGGFASILQDIVKSPIEFFEVEPTFCRPLVAESDLNPPELRT